MNEVTTTHNYCPLSSFAGGTSLYLCPMHSKNNCKTTAKQLKSSLKGHYKQLNIVSFKDCYMKYSFVLL